MRRCWRLTTMMKMSFSFHLFSFMPFDVHIYANCTQSYILYAAIFSLHPATHYAAPSVFDASFYLHSVDFHCFTFIQWLFLAQNDKKFIYHFAEFTSSPSPLPSPMKPIFYFLLKRIDLMERSAKKQINRKKLKMKRCESNGKSILFSLFSIQPYDKGCLMFAILAYSMPYTCYSSLPIRPYYILGSSIRVFRSVQG